MAKVDTGFCQNCFDVFHYLAGFGFNIVHYQFAVYRVHRNLPRNKQKATRNYSLAIGTYRRRCICSIDNYFHYFFVKKMLSPLTTHHSPLTTHHSPLTTHHSPLTTNHPPPATRHPPPAGVSNLTGRVPRPIVAHLRPGGGSPRQAPLGQQAPVQRGKPCTFWESTRHGHRS